MDLDDSNIKEHAIGQNPEEIQTTSQVRSARARTHDGSSNIKRTFSITVY